MLTAKGISLHSTSHSPRMRGVNHRGAAGRREPPLSAWEKWERLKEKWPRNDKSAERQGQVPPVSARSLMWNSCRQGLTSCVLTHRTHFRDDGSTSTFPVVFLKPPAGEMKVLTIKHLLPLILMRTLFMQLLLLSVSLTYIIPDLRSIYTSPKTTNRLRFVCIECVISIFFDCRKILHSSHLWLSWLEGSKVIFSR